jgi:hypothetical protein
MSVEITRMTIDIPVDIKNQAKAIASLSGKKLKDYVIDALSEKISGEQNIEDKFALDLAKKGEKSGYLGKKESADLLLEMSKC